ncbi:hypothetical protein H6788_00625 [Candidatus Nomurabacteria bacterium]|nr:hypothetical protein [Candidatus Nomurabacteria bacterium]MCB9819413.1 hypothetical protein [Candidatus Nomurabacteria bacterium]
MPPDSDISSLKKAVEKQNVLLEENNQMLHKLRRYQTTTFWLTMIWYALLVGLPFAVYYYIIGPYVEALGFSNGEFSASIKEIPGYSQFENFFGLGGE